MKTLELQVRQEEDKHLVEALYLKREVQRMAAILDQERQQIEEERHNLLVMQNTAREQAELRQKTLQARLRSALEGALDHHHNRYDRPSGHPPVPLPQPCPYQNRR